MSPVGSYDADAQVASLDSRLLYKVNQGVVAEGQTVAEQLAARGIGPSDLACVLMSHLDCDHANGLPDLRGASPVLVAPEELAFAAKFPNNVVRYRRRWWKDSEVKPFEWNGSEGPAGKSFDVFGDGALTMINIPGHSDGLCALKVAGGDGRFVLLYSDGGYATRSWREQILPGISADKTQQKRSLEWIGRMSLDGCCVESLANHDPDVKPHTIELS